jgi:restriction endonuclease Mrr
MQHQLEGIRQREIESWKQQTLDSVTDIQVGLRNMIADKISQLKTRLDRTPMTESELEAERESGKQRVADPSRITQASINKLVAHIDELTEELGQFESTDQFYQAVSELRRSLGFEGNFDDAATRQQLSQDIEHIVNLAVDDTTINPKTGDFFVSLM